MKDKSEREYAKLSQVKEGDIVELDDDFTCASGHVTILKDVYGLYFNCRYGVHYIAGQAGNGEDLIGIYPT